MNWYYVSNGQQAGPVDDAQLAELARNGSVLFDTLIWREGMDNWQSYGQVHVPSAPPPVAPPPTIPPAHYTPPGAALCSECGGTFALDQVIRYENRFVCAACKPIFFQRLREGGTLAGPVRGGATEADILARDYQVDVGACLTRAWEMFKANAGPMIGASILVYLCLMASNIIPYLGIVLGLILTGPLIGGLWLFYIKLVRNQPARVGDAFGGFGPRFWQFSLAQLIPSLLAFGMMMMFGIVAGLALPAIALSQGGRVGSSSGLPAFLIIFGGFGVLIAGVVMCYFNTCWLFALPLVGDKGMQFWPALQLSRRVVNKHWWQTFWLLIVSGLLMMAGALACLVGMLVTGPVAVSMIACHYDRVFGDLTPNP